MIIWIIGLPGAGKTSVGRTLVHQLKSRKPATVLLDGDSLREIMGNDLGHSLDDRRKNGWRMCRLGAFLDREGVDVVCCIMSLFHEQQDWNRANVHRYFEVYLRVSMATLEQRDQKGLYSGARTGRLANVPGVDIPFPAPKHPDLVLDNDESLQRMDPMAARIVAEIDRRWGHDVSLQPK